MKDYKVSVIVPVYNIRDFIEECLRSLISQTMTEVEYIIVDDASTDGSYEIIKNLVSDNSNFKIVRHERNLGLPAARNTGLKMASGVYILHCDGDDYMEPSMVERLYNHAKETSADMVWCDWYLSFSEEERFMKQPDFQSGKEAMLGMLHGRMKHNVWNKLCKRSLYENISFPSGKTMGEDMTMIKIAALAGVVSHVSGPLYHYRRTNTEALTQNYTLRKLEELTENTLDIINFVTKIHNDLTEEDINKFYLNVKLPFLFTGKKEDIFRWRQWYPEANREIIRNKDQSLRTRILEWSAFKGLTWINLLYYHLVHRIIYGTIYR